jgi:hypothetical protein
MTLSWGRIWKINLAVADHLKPCSVKLSFQIRPQLIVAPILGGGSLPLDVLEKKVKGWVAGQRQSRASLQRA